MNRKNLLTISGLFLLFAGHVSAQHRIGFALRGGPGYYVGDLKRTLLPEGRYMRPVVGASVHYRYRYFLDLSYRFSYGELVGGDALGQVQPARNLDFKTFYYTNELRLNYYPVIVFSDGVHRKRASTAACSFGNESPREIFKPSIGLGVGHFHFNPYSTSGPDGTVFLRPLGTEGQNIPGYKKPYSLNQPVLIYDIGFIVNPMRRLELEVNVEYLQLFTDYLDDVSGTYPGQAALLANGGAQSVAYSYRGTGAYPAEGTPRGNPLLKDGSFRGFITLRYLFEIKTGHTSRDPNVLHRTTKKKKRGYYPKDKTPQQKSGGNGG